MKREVWFIDVNEWLDEAEQCKGGMAFSKSMLDEMEMSEKGMVEVISAEYCESLEKRVEDLEATEKVYHMNREWIRGAKERIESLECECQMLREIASCTMRAHGSLGHGQPYFDEANRIRDERESSAVGKSLAAKFFEKPEGEL